MYASLFFLLRVTLVANCLLQWGQNNAPGLGARSIELLMILSTYIRSKTPLPTFWYKAILFLQWPQQISMIAAPLTLL